MYKRNHKVCKCIRYNQIYWNLIIKYVLNKDTINYAMFHTNN